MHASSLLAFVLLLQGQTPDAKLAEIRDAVARGNRDRVESLFVRRTDADKLFTMAEERGGLRTIKVSILPEPPGWAHTGPYWIVFHTRQDIEQESDKVFSLIKTGDGFSIGSEIHEGTPQSVRIRHLKIDAEVVPAQAKAIVVSQADLEPWSGKGAVVFRLGNNYSLQTAFVDGISVPIVSGDQDKVPTPAAGSIVRAGSLAVVWKEQPPSQIRFHYEGIVRSNGEDKIAPNAAYVTAWWTPSIARLPYTTATRIVAPSDWHAVSEGVPAEAEEAGFESIAVRGETKVSVFRCDVPISYPKIIAGKYTLAAEAKDPKGRTFRAYHLDPVQPERGKRDVALMLEGVEFFEKSLGEWPFPGYACYDADTYYGIESYSHTLLRRSITTTFVTHEMGHTYFGGLVPSAYVKDSWNEGLTQYVDSVLFRNNRDGTLQNGLRTIGIPVPLTQIPAAHSHGSATYFRGAYAMKMLEAEIGKEKVLDGLRELVKARRGKETTWPDLRSYFEKAGGKDLRWFWSQWIEGSEFPTLRIVSAQVVQRDNRFSTFVTVDQSGTYAPFRLRFKVKVRSLAGVLGEREVELAGNRESYRIDSDTKPTEAMIDVFPLALARPGDPVPVRE